MRASLILPILKTLIFHDTFLMRGGAERMDIDMANILSADIATAIWSTHCYDPADMGYHGEIYEVFPGFHRGWVGFIRMKWSFFWSRALTKKYDTVVLSNEAITAVHLLKKGTKSIYYAHSLSRHLFDQRDEYMKKVPFFFHEFFAIAVWFLRLLYLYELKKIDIILTNSVLNQQRLIAWTGKDNVKVLYPPVNMLRFRPVKEKIPYIIQEHNNVESTIEKEIKDYYVSFARLTAPKRIDRIIHAFIHMPEKNLIILYGPHDTEKESLMKMAMGANNIFFLNEPRDMKMAGIVASAVASIAVSKNEDFGMVAIESMSCGIPVIAVDEGGYQETIIDKKTGTLLLPDFTVYQLMEAVKEMTPEKALSMKEDCIAQAHKFSIESFSVNLKNLLEQK